MHWLYCTAPTVLHRTIWHYWNASNVMYFYLCIALHWLYKTALTALYCTDCTVLHCIKCTALLWLYRSSEAVVHHSQRHPWNAPKGSYTGGPASWAMCKVQPTENSLRFTVKNALCSVHSLQHLFFYCTAVLQCFGFRGMYQPGIVSWPKASFVPCNGSSPTWPGSRNRLNIAKVHFIVSLNTNMHANF